MCCYGKENATTYGTNSKASTINYSGFPLTREDGDFYGAGGFVEGGVEGFGYGA